MGKIDTKRAQTLRAKADALSAKIEAKLNPACGNQRPTRRRANMAAGIRSEGYALQTIQRGLYRLADLHLSGEVPALLEHIKAVSDAQSLRDAAREVFESLAGSESSETKRARELAELERSLIGRKIPGFFPTPAPLAELVVREADIQPGMGVLEPSAGAGHLGDAVRESCPAASLTCIEVNHTLYTILCTKKETLWKGGAQVAMLQGDFLELNAVENVDRVVMNPPFENGQDAEHVLHAWKFLKAGGRLVAVMGEGIFYRSDKKAQAFREWLYQQNGVAYILPAGSFLNSANSTGVATRLLVLDKTLPVYDEKPAENGSGGESTPVLALDRVEHERPSPKYFEQRAQAAGLLAEV